MPMYNGDIKIQGVLVAHPQLRMAGPIFPLLAFGASV